MLELLSNFLLSYLPPRTVEGKNLLAVVRSLDRGHLHADLEVHPAADEEGVL